MSNKISDGINLSKDTSVKHGAKPRKHGIIRKTILLLSTQLNAGLSTYNEESKISGLLHGNNVINTFTEDPPDKTINIDGIDSVHKSEHSTKNLDIISHYKKLHFFQPHSSYNSDAEMNNYHFGLKDVNQP